MNLTSPVKRGRKYDEVLSGARHVFLRDGFDGASVDDIARAAGVSKATVYSYFSDKRLLFLEIARAEIATLTDRAMTDIDRTAPPAQVLTQAGQTIIGFSLSVVGLGIFRLCIAEGERFPELAQAFFEAGPMATQAALCDYFAEAQARGELRIEDPELAADQFVELCRADLQMRLLMRVPPPPSPRDVERVLTGAVEMFLARYATGPV
ncbi:transcriptional regulator [Dinoroseobacter shibae DFL 12 = DSM 16493]|jgi:AcrR family transcriptional regulator|uniref:Transcriptional regulator n=1 Tax=Dinoroseobacter shibae (strain DSM 16493 / NCIMB 14021 / DFL 12) TaxID=398580 RepID=A8LKL2_DINSH|nr:MULTISPECIES: TetR/AcrR family transcriptional regulator [Dinoroseobacter]ABV91855.1 transcriptional regulator [Dinoroseobacter shibae DFL 12 = DSM 16493]MDD9717236.1 TetR/AcrR family transcriptional regulator [Dinoroseobacter sp. PD6]URF46833.1 TetR/AcrR family transcriptional regulator [Dinoroseobacter shibae]URF51144.1 TetR/AcrR family transcriptional regulator [Dinoroseobacter shibae]